MSAWNFYLQGANAEKVKVDSNRKLSSKGGNLIFEAVDKIAQQDARRIRWSGKRPATLSIITPYAQDLCRYAANDAALTFDLKVDQVPSKEVFLNLLCDGDCNKSVEFTERLRESKLGEYTTYQYVLSCFANKAESMLNQLNGALEIGTDGVLDISVANIKILPNVAPSNLAPCTVSEVATN